MFIDNFLMMNSPKNLVKWKSLNWYLEEARMDLKQKHFTILAIIKDLLSLLFNRKMEKYLGLILIFLGHLIGDFMMEIAILLFSLSEMILILSNLNAWENQWKFFIIHKIWHALEIQVCSGYTTTAIYKNVGLG